MSSSVKADGTLTERESFGSCAISEVGSSNTNSEKGTFMKNAGFVIPP
jgi:hypothetical protein